MNSKIIVIFATLILMRQLTMTQDFIKTRVIGVDISVDVTVFAIVDVRGNILARQQFPTKEYPNINEFVTRLSEGIIEMVESNDGYEAIRSVGISTPSGNFQTGCIENAPNLMWKGQVPLAAMLRDRLGLAVALGNDVHARALGEHVYGSAHGMNDFIVVNLGHGVGSCVYIGGKPHLGTDGFAGEVGHSCVADNGRLCGCGNRGCLEAYAGTNGIVKTAMEILQEDNRPSLMREHQADLDPKMIFEFCEQGDELSQEVFRRTGHILGISLANYASVLNPEAIILCGGISHAGKWLVEPTDESFEEHIFHNSKRKVKLLVSNLNENERDLLGASALAWNVKEYSLFK